MKTNRKILLGIFTILFIFSFLFLAFVYFKDYKHKIFIEAKKDVCIIEYDVKFEKNIKNKEDKKNKIYLDLPGKVENSGIYTYKFNKKNYLKNVLSDYTYVNLNSDSVDYVVSHNGFLIYDSREVKRKIKRGQNVFDLILIERGCFDDNLRFDFFAKESNQHYIELPKIIIGEKSAIIFYHLKNEFFYIIFSMILIISFLFSILHIYMFISEKQYFLIRNFLYLGVFDLFLGIYILTNTYSFEYFLNNSSFLYIVSGTMLNVLIVPIILRGTDLFTNLKRKKTLIFYYVALIVVMLNAVFQVFAVKNLNFSFSSMENITFYLNFFIIMIMGCTLFFVERSEYKYINYYIFTIISMVIFSNVGVESMVNRTSNNRFLYFIIGFFVFFFIHQYIYLKNFVEGRKLDIQRDFWQNLSKRDNFTRLLNRTSYEEDLEKIKIFLQKEENKNIVYIMMDINNLKKVNDTFGHEKGDDLIKTAADIILNVEKNFEKFKGYRIGGDEFVLMKINTSLDEIKEVLDFIDLDKKIEAMKNNVENIFQMAVGYEYEELKNLSSIKEIIIKAEEKMYGVKRKMKEEGGFYYEKMD